MKVAETTRILCSCPRSIALCDGAALVDLTKLEILGGSLLAEIISTIIIKTGACGASDAEAQRPV